MPPCDSTRRSTATARATSSPGCGIASRSSSRHSMRTYRLVPHAPAAPARPHRARRRDARAILRRAVAGGLAARDRSGGARGRILPRRPGRGVDLHPTAVLRAARPGLDPSGREEALVRHVEEPPRLQPGDSAGGPYASDTRGEAAFRAEVHARGCEAAVAPTPPTAPTASP